MNWDAAFLLAGIILIKMVSGTGNGPKTDRFNISPFWATLGRFNFSPLKAMGLFGPMLPTLANNCNVGIVFEHAE